MLEGAERGSDPAAYRGVARELTGAAMRTCAVIPTSASRQHGLSLVEVMVGVLIGLIGIVVIFQVLALSEERKRTTGAGSDAQISGSIGMYNLERDLRLAGYGFGTSTFLGCTVSAYDAQRTTTNFTFALAPVVLTNGVGGAPDTIAVLYGSSSMFVNTQTYSTASATSKRTQGRTGFLPGDVVVVANSTPACALVEITANTNADGATIDHATGSYVNALSQTVTARYNPPAGSPISSGQGNLYNLGASPRLNLWQISGNKLRVTDNLHWIGASGTAIEVADGVIDLQAEYGVDGDNNNRIDDTEWTSSAPADWTNLLAIRVALLARSQQYEKLSVTTTAPAWAGGSFVMKNVDGTTDTSPGNANDWRRYRYRVYQVTIPLRNMIWGTT
jgi:type IV pilus assembly protein PilW